MKRMNGVLCVSFAVVAMGLSAPATSAGVDVSFGVNAPVGDDGNLFFSISSQYFNRQPQVVNDWGRRYTNPDDLAVFLQICSRSRKSPQVVHGYRQQGMSWYEVGMRVGLPVEVWYVPVAVEPIGPYAKPYKHYKKHKHDPHYVVRLTDRQVRDLVAMRMAHEYYGVSPEVAMDWRRGGSNLQVIMTREYRSRHRGRGHGDDDSYNGHDSNRNDHDSHHGKNHGKNHGKKDGH